jgi:endoglucanase
MAGRVRGVNLSGLDFVGGHQTPLPAAIAYYRAAGMNAFRVPIAWELLQPVLDGPLDPTVLAALRATVDACGAASRVILELHCSGRYREVLVGTPGGPSLRQLGDAYHKLALAFPGRDFGTVNEPHDMPDLLVAAMANTVIAAIRSAPGCWGSLILVSFNGYSNRQSFRSGAANYDLVPQIYDPARNWSIDYHCYLDQWSAGQSTAIDPGFLADIQCFATWCEVHGFTAVCSEIGFGCDATSLAAGDQAIAFIEQRPKVFRGWLWWGAGGWWPHDYRYLLDPYGSRWDNANPDAARAASWAAPLPDRPQMRVLSRYLGH